MFWQKLRKISGEGGQVLLLSAFAMTALLGLVAMVVDAGIYLQERRQLQNAADAAVLAGVPFLPGDTGTAEAAARAWAANNDMDPSEITSVAFENGNTLIRVQLQRDVPALFARALGFIDFEVNASAAAQTGSALGPSGLVPFAILDDELGASCGSPYTGCTEVRLKYDSNNGPPESNFGLIRIDCTGASCVENTIIGGSDSPLCSTQAPLSGCPSQKDSESGNNTGPVQDGVEWRLDPSNNLGCNTLTNVIDAYGKVITGCNPWGAVAAEDTDGDGGTCDNLPSGNGSCRLIAVPVIDEFAQGTGPETITGFALFWLESIAQPCGGNHCEVAGYYLDAHASISGIMGGYDPTSNPFVVSKLVE